MVLNIDSIKRLFIPTLLVFLLSAKAMAEDRWIELRTDHFLAVGNAAEGKSRVFLRKLEQFHRMISELFGLESVSSTPLTIIIFKDERSFNPYKFYRNGKRVDVAGYFQRGRERDMIAANVGSNVDPADLMFHEYMHRLTAYARHPWPVWLNEGLAEFYSTYRLSGDKATIGAPVESHVFFLREKRRLMPIEQLIGITLDSPEYNEGDKRGLFYAQSWALVHFLMMAEKTAYREQLIRYTELLSNRGDPREIFPIAFNFSFDELERRLRRYVEQDRYFGTVHSLESARQEIEVKAEPIGPDRWKVYLGDLLAQTRRPDEARKLYQEALDAGDSSGDARQRLAGLDESSAPRTSATRRTTVTRLERSAEPSEEEPREIPPDEPVVPGFAEAKSLLDDIGDELGEGDQPQIDETFRQIEAVLGVNPDYAPAHNLFAEAALVTGQRLEEGIVHARRAISLDPDEEQFRVTLAQLHMFSDQFEEARKAIEPLLHSKSVIRADYAARMIENVAIMLKYQGTGQPGATQQEDPDSGDPMLPDPENCKPSFVDVSAMDHSDVRLSELQCGENGLVFLGNLNGQPVQFFHPQPQDPVVYSCSVELDSLTCGPFEAPARIYFDAGQDPTRGPVRARAVEVRRQ